MQPVNIDTVLMMNNEEQKIDVQIGNITIEILPAMVRTVRNVMNSIGKLQVSELILFIPLLL